MSAKKTGGHSGIVKARNQSRAAELSKRNVFRVSCRDPITNRITACDSHWVPPRMKGITG